MKFKEKILENLKRVEKITTFQQYAGWVEKFREDLETEGFPTDRKTILKIVEENGFENYLTEAANSYIKKVSPIPNTEKDRIKTVYRDIQERLQRSANEARSALLSGVELKEDGEVDDVKLEKTAIEEATAYYDVEKMTAYFNVIEPLLTAYRNVKKYSEENGLSYYTQLINENGMITNKVFNFLMRDNEEWFQNDFGFSFRTSKK